MDNQQGWGIKFAEHMGGFFSEGNLEPSEGFDKGRAGGSPIDFWVKIHITPLREFFEDKDKVAVMTGRFSAAGLGADLPLENGEFNIFAGEEGSGFKHITYKFGFTAAGEPHYFSGVKNIRLNKKEGSRKDNVTLFSRVYKGGSEDGELLGAGILTFDLLKDGPGLALSMRATGAKSFGEKLRAMRQFAALANT